MSEPLNESEEALLEKVISGDLAVHSLEKSLSSTQQNNSPSPQLHHNSPFELAVRLRRGWLQHETSFDPCALPYQGLDYASIHGACAEMVVGYVPLPVGVAGPLLLNGELLQLPMATVEGTLIASTRRGCKAITESGGASAVVMQHMMSRAPVLLFPSAMRAAAFKEWMEDPKQADTISTHFNGTSRFANFQSVRVTVAGKYAYARFCCSTGDAMGMNMISKAVNAVLDFVHNEHFNDMQILGLSGNMCCDKKPAAVNWIEGRGCSVVVEATIRGDVVQKVLKTSVDAVVQLNNAKNLVGSAMAGMASGGYNAHAANIVAAIFIATGQDPAQVVESANCITLLTPSENGEDLHISCTMPSIEVGTVGGGTHLAPQKACLELLGVAGASTDKPGGNARKLAMIVASAVMAAELSLLSALVQGHLIRAHMQYNRKAPSASETKAAD